MVTILLITSCNNVQGQTIYGQRLPSVDGQWVLPVASRLLCSDAPMHVRRGSIPSWDICAPAGTPIYPAAPGRVIYAGCNNQGGYGCWVKLDHGNGITSAYAHMIQGSITVATGAQLSVDMVMGQVGWTGMTSFGPHVHFVIYANGRHLDPAKFFDQAQMQFCDKCASPAGNAAPVGSVAGQAQPTATTAQSPLAPILQALGTLDEQELTYLSFIVIFALLFALWLANNAIRVIMVAGLVATACSALTITMLMPTQAAATATSTTPADFDIAYSVVRGQEGKGCDTYIVRTLNGVTQWTYDRYNRERGVPRSDVCNNLTEQEAKDIYYRYYWQPSGLDGISMAVAMQVFDHSINAGVGQGKAILAACGNNATCVAQQRRSFYNSTKTCKTRSVVCGAWLRRVDSVYRKATQNVN